MSLGTKQLRDVFLALIEELTKRNVEYCVCGNYLDLPDSTTNDIDMWVEKPDEALQALKAVTSTHGYRLYLSNATLNGTNNFFYRQEADGFTFLHIDFLKDCSWSSVVTLVSAEQIKNNRTGYKNFKVANGPVDASMHLLYPLIQYGKIKDKYQDDFARHCEDHNFIEVITAALGKGNAKPVIGLIAGGHWDRLKSQVGALRIAILLRALSKMNLKSLLTPFQYIRNVTGRLFRPNGLMIAVIGPDGAGKTTTLSSVAGLMQDICPVGKFRVYYWRPFLLPELNRILPLRKPMPAMNDGLDFFHYRKKQISSSLLARVKYLIKFCYYSIDFILGWVKILPIKARGGIICFDRYYYDHMVYPERFGFSVPGKLMAFVERFIYKPDLVFLLAPPNEVLLARKQELPLDELVRQKEGYAEVADRYGFHSVDTSTSPAETVNTILQACLSFMSRRYDA